MQFFEYNRGDIHPLIYPMTSDLPKEKEVFLIYAENMEKAKETARKHLDGKALTDLNNHRLNAEVVYVKIPDVAVQEMTP